MDWMCVGGPLNGERRLKIGSKLEHAVMHADRSVSHHVYHYDYVFYAAGKKFNYWRHSSVHQAAAPQALLVMALQRLFDTSSSAVTRMDHVKRQD